MAHDLVTDRLHLRSRRVSDSTAIRGLWLERDRRSARLVDAEGHPTLDEMRHLVSAQLQESEVTGLSLLAIERRDTPGFIGYCGLTVGAATLAEPEIAFELNRDVHGQGYATEAALAVVDAARVTGRSRLWASVFEWNAPSLTLLRRLGFSLSGHRSVDADRGDTVWLTLDLSAT